MEIVKRAIIKQGGYYGKPGMVGGSDGLLANLIPFDSQGAMWARRYDGTEDAESFGRYESHVGDGLRVRFYADSGPLYVVYSYATPIGWVTSSGSIVVPDEKYSVTTTNHQNLCHAFMGKGRVWSDQDQTHISWTTQAVRDAGKGVWV